MVMCSSVDGQNSKEGSQCSARPFQRRKAAGPNEAEWREHRTGGRGPGGGCTGRDRGLAPDLPLTCGLQVQVPS